MSEVHVYGVVPASAEIEVAEEAVRLVAYRDIAAVVSDIERTELKAVSVLRTHWRVLEQVSTRTTVLPVRFGTVMVDDTAVVDEFLEPEHEELAASLAALAGKVQLTVKGFYEEDALMADVVARSPEIARLREDVQGLPEAAAYYKRIELGQRVAAEVERSRERDARDVFERLSPLAVDARLEPPSTIDSAVNAAFLVEDRRIETFNEAVTALGQELAGRIHLRYIGPLPPYSFTGDTMTPGEQAWA
jgi:Gas vesicle synthesis protein GvpL/GvpF